IDTPRPRGLLDRPVPAKRRSRRPPFGHAARSRGALPVGDRSAAPNGGGAGRPCAAGVGERRDVARLLPRAPSPPVRVLPSRAGDRAPVRALRSRPRERDGAHVAVHRPRAAEEGPGPPDEAQAGGTEDGSAVGRDQRGAGGGLRGRLRAARGAVPGDRPLAVDEPRGRGSRPGDDRRRPLAAGTPKAQTSYPSSTSSFPPTASNASRSSGAISVRQRPTRLTLGGLVTSSCWRARSSAVIVPPPSGLSSRISSCLRSSARWW